MPWRFLLLFWGATFPAVVAYADAVERLNLERLRATHEQVQALAKAVEPVELETGYGDYRAIVHAHSHYSHDSVGTIEEILAAAHATEVRVIMFSNHPADWYDYYEDTDKGMRDGVLLVAGAETGGLLVYPTRSLQSHASTPPQPFVEVIRESGGLSFVSHLEERLDWELEQLTGNEIYNTHADLMDERRLLGLLRSPLGLLRMLPALEQFPQETFACIQDYPADYLAAWDRWCQRAPHTGVAANDSHHNQAYRGTVTEEGHLLIEDALGDEVADLDPEKIAPVKLFIGQRKPGEEVFNLDLDPYDRSFRHVSTHLLMNELTQEAVWDALSSGRAYVAFDWMADPTGFAYLAESKADGEARRWDMGSGMPLVEELKLLAEAPLSGEWRVIRNGERVQQSDGRTLEFPVDEPGVYRVELWLTIAGEPRLWILSNPVYVHDATSKPS